MDAFIRAWANGQPLTVWRLPGGRGSLQTVGRRFAFWGSGQKRFTVPGQTVGGQTVNSQRFVPGGPLRANRDGQRSTVNGLPGVSYPCNSWTLCICICIGICICICICICIFICICICICVCICICKCICVFKLSYIRHYPEKLVWMHLSGHRQTVNR